MAQRTRGLLSDQLNQRGVQFIRLEAEGTGTALEDDVLARVDQINAIRPTGVGLLGGIAELVKHGGKLDAKLANARAGNQRAFFFVLGTGKDDVVANVAFHLPNVAGMGFKNVDDKKSDLAAVLIVELVEGRSLPPEGRSSVASEDQHDGLLRGQRRQLNSLSFVEGHQGEVRGGIAGVQRASPGLGP